MNEVLSDIYETVPGSTRSSFVRQIQSGSESAWHEFYRKYSAMIHRVGQDRGLNSRECDELMVDVMVIFWKKVDEFAAAPERGKLRTYLSRIAAYAANKLKSHSSQVSGEKVCEEDAEYPADVDAAYMEEWRSFILSCAMEELKNSVDTETYQVFYMSVVQKRPVNDIAAVTRKTANNIYVIRSRCIKKLKQLIAHYRELEESELLRHSNRNEQLD